MPFLKTLKGNLPGQVLTIEADKTVLGRHPNCEVVLDDIAVSRQHAQILRDDSMFTIEDLRSRNQTFVNGKVVEGQVRLADGDRIKICGLVFEFSLKHPDERGPVIEDLDSSGHLQPTSEMQQLDLPDFGSSPDDSSASSIISTLDVVSSSWRLSVKPEVKLRAVLEISQALSAVLNVEDVLPKLLDGLFRIFPQADEGFIMLRDEESNRMRVEATKVRRADRNEGSVRVSMTIVRQAMETGNAILSADALEDSRFKTSQSLSDLRIRSMMCVPLIGKSGDRLGVIQIDSSEVRQRFTQDDLEVLASVASQSSLAVENARLHESRLRQNELQRELEFAAQVQGGFLPKECPDLPGYGFADYYEAAQSVGGDFFDYVPLKDGRLALLLGDVAGKGVAAALLMARLYSAARYHLLTTETAGEALAGLNSEIATGGLGHRFVTFLIAILDPETHQLETANAGHLPLLLRSASGEVTGTDRFKSGMPLGIMPDQEFQVATLDIKPGDACVMYTDGVTESMDFKNNLYGMQRLEEYLAKPVESADELVEGLVQDVEAFCEGRSQADDMCIVALYRQPNER